MTKWAWGRVVSVLVVVASLGSGAQGARQEENTILDGDVTLVNFEDLDYPQLARAVRVQGVVVVRVHLGPEGDVLSAFALSGPRLLTAAATENVKKWRFKAVRQRTAIVVYDFNIGSGTCHDRSRSLFQLRHWNYASIMSCENVIEG